MVRRCQKCGGDCLTDNGTCFDCAEQAYDDRLAYLAGGDAEYEAALVAEKIRRGDVK